MILSKLLFVFQNVITWKEIEYSSVLLIAYVVTSLFSMHIWHGHNWWCLPGIPGWYHGTSGKLLFPFISARILCTFWKGDTIWFVLLLHYTEESHSLLTLSPQPLMLRHHSDLLLSAEPDVMYQKSISNARFIL